MIQSKMELMEYLMADKIALGIDKKYPSLVYGVDLIWKYQILYRKYEYARNVLTNKINIPYIAWLKFRFTRKSIQLGFSIPINVFGKGLSIAHYGTIVVNGNAKVGEYCRIQENVTIGSTNGLKFAPNIGNRVFIGSGAKIIGNIQIADDIVIGAGCVVTKSFCEQGITIAGIPAKKISDNNSHTNLNPAIFKEQGV